MRGSRKFCQRGSNSDNGYSIYLFLFIYLFYFFFFFFDDDFFFLIRGERIQIALNAGHHRPASETPLNDVSLAGR